MNVYLRYFDDETLVSTFEEALDFLHSLKEINVDEFLENDLRKYMESNVVYPKHFKVSNRCHFIAIKSQAATMAEFKRAGTAQHDINAEKAALEEQKESFMRLNPGWYEASVLFRRVILNPEKQKSQYVDSTFRAKVKANSIQHCYERVIEHLKGRADIDNRSQFPSIKSRNFSCNFLSE